MVGLPTVASAAAVLRGLTPVRYAAATQWSDPVVPSGGSADFDHRPVITVVWFFTASSDSMTNGSLSGSAPSACGPQRPGAMPCGKKMPTKRGFGATALCAIAGVIASSSGSASVTPAPRRKRRRGICFFITNDMVCSLWSFWSGCSRTLRTIPVVRLKPDRTYYSDAGPHVRLLRFRVRLERRAANHREHQRGEPIVLLRDVARDRPHQRHVLVVEPAAERVGQQLLDADAHELARIPRHPLPQRDGAVHHRVVEELRRGVDGRPLVCCAP